MRLLRNILMLALALAGFALGFIFVSVNDTPVTLDFLVPGWHWQAAAGAQVLAILVAGLVLGLLAGLGLKALLRRPGGGQ